jgi:hypothetical protein
MGAIYSHAVHASGQQIADQFIIDGRFGRHCDHDSDVAVFRGRPEEEICVPLEETLALLPVAGLIVLWRRISLGAV